jgi:acyl dehydratase
VTGVERLQARVGESATPIEGLTITGGAIEAFARAVGDDDPVYRTPETATDRGFSAVPAPLTFVRTSRFPRYATGEELDLGLDREYVLHGEQAYEYDRPLVVGDTLTGERTLTDAYEREGDRGGTMTFVEVKTVYRDDDGDAVVTDRATLVETDGAVTDDAGQAPTPGVDYDPREGATERLATDTVAPDPVADPTVGDVAPTVELGPLSRRDFVRYAGASGDFNPVHYDEPYAIEAGNPSVFGQGMFTAGVAAHCVGDFLGLAAVRSFAVRFLARVFPGDTITARAEVEEVASTPDGERVTAAVSVERRPVDRTDTETVLTGEATATTDR